MGQQHQRDGGVCLRKVYNCSSNAESFNVLSWHSHNIPHATRFYDFGFKECVWDTKWYATIRNTKYFHHHLQFSQIQVLRNTEYYHNLTLQQLETEMSHPVRAFRLISHVHKNIEAIKESTFPTARINGELLSLFMTCISKETQA